MHARMTHLLTTRHGPHDSDMSTGGGKAVELTYSGYLWLDKSWPVAVDGVACHHSAMVCFISPRVSTESDRKIDLSQRVS